MNLPSHAPAGRILAVASGKGGVGKTVLAAALAQAFSSKGERLLLIDGDLGMANIDVQLGLQPDADLAAVMSGQVLLEDACIPVLGGPAKPGGFDVISGRSGSGGLAGLRPDAVNRLAAACATIALSYERAILDLAAGADDSTLRLAMAADDVLIVINDEPTSLTDAYAFVKRLRIRDESAAPLVVVNNAPTLNKAREAYGAFRKTCQSFLGFAPALAGLVSRDEHVPLAIRAQSPLSLRSPDCDAMKDIACLAAGLAAGREAA
ncbi:AAA family ATPase [Hyphobacterium sp. HN65]|uniref:AAA family ATPase n=1 Tax=Hyphobacterium lacteum TaxID=3116575 RepID=A0ABU7LQB4_9PROT|nr:AAA family ATPase [Hyphobacterium sp. HN65]MEE2526105.1 AAA family ATPase [Hyphobacterium sp. HN65]